MTSIFADHTVKHFDFLVYDSRCNSSLAASVNSDCPSAVHCFGGPLPSDQWQLQQLRQRANLADKLFCRRSDTVVQANHELPDEVFDSCDDTSEALRCFLGARNATRISVQQRLNTMAVRRGPSPRAACRPSIHRTVRCCNPQQQAQPLPSRLSSAAHRRRMAAVAAAAAGRSSSPIPVPVPSPASRAAYASHRQHCQSRAPADVLSPSPEVPVRCAARSKGSAAAAARSPYGFDVELDVEAETDDAALVMVGARRRGGEQRGSGGGGNGRDGATLQAIKRFYDVAREERAKRPPGRPLLPQRVVLGFEL